MSGRKLQTEIERTFKKVAEGVEVFEGIFDKIHQAATQAQKDKLETELKKEIKKLQRFRDQIKTWAASSDIKDKTVLVDNRKLIETQMERFKAMERELKTKAFSEAGLNAASRVDPEVRDKDVLRQWLAEMTDTLNTQIDAFEAEQEILRAGGRKGKRADKDRLQKIDHSIERHKHHQTCLEIILRMLDNGNLKPDEITNIKDDVAWYVDSNQDPDYEEDEGMYDVLNLEEGAYGIGNEDDGDDSDKESEPSPKSSPAPPESRRKVKAEKEEEQAKKSAVKELPQKTNIPKDLPRPKNAPLRTPASPAARAPGPIPTEPVPLPQKYAAAAAVHIAQSKLEPAKPSSQTKALIEVPAAAPLQGSPTPKQKILKLPDSAPVTASVAKSRPLAGVVQEIPKSEKKLAEIPETHYAPPLSDLVASFQSAKQKSLKQDSKHHLKLLEASFKQKPDAVDSCKPKSYFPKSPYPVPGYYPQTPLSLFESSPIIFERFDLDTLFFIFYFRPGSLQQYLAARELKRQSWRFHKNFLTWFQRHEEPKAITEDFEEGTYIYFDYEDAWCQRKKLDFRFEYRYLEDDL